MKIAHESPNSFFRETQQVTDYDYALVHLFEENKEYLQHFIDALKNNRTVILDNSVFELGHSFEMKKFVEWIKFLKPTEYIVPDVLENYKETISNYKNFIKSFKNLPGTAIGVVQGKTYQEIVDCYKELEELGCQKIAISFDYSYYTEQFPNEEKLQAWCLGRQQLIKKLWEEGVINPNLRHHLLGVGLAREFAFYKDYPFIESIDTSNPVVAGIKGLRYDGVNGLNHKPSTKLCDLITIDLTEKQKEDILYNIEQFRAICNK